MQKFNKDRC